MTVQRRHKTVTQDDVAQYAGVSRSIVSYVINNGPRNVSEETRIRVLDAIKALDYRPNKYAQMLSNTGDGAAQRTIGIVLSNNAMLKRPYYGTILASIHEHAHKRDHHIRFIRVFSDFNNPALFNELIHPNEISSVILIGLDQVLETPDDYALAEAIIQRVERVVCVEWEWTGVTSVRFDRQNAAYQATKHLLNTGRSKVVYFGPSDKRVSGYQQALWEHGLQPDPACVLYAVESPAAYETCNRFLQTNISLDAVCAGTDEAAVGIYKSLQEHGLMIPDDVAVASIDNLDFAPFLNPSLTSVDIPKDRIGFHTVDALLSETARDTAVSLTIPTTLLVRDSSVRSQT